MGAFSRTCALGFIGQAARDFYLFVIAISADSRRVRVKHRDKRWSLRILDGSAGPGAKLTVANIPPSLRHYAASVRFGGGALNSLMCARLIGASSDLRYVDTSLQDAQLATTLLDLNVPARFLGIRGIPENVVVGVDNDRLILKSPISRPVDRLVDSQAAALDTLLDCPAILVNSCKDPAVVQYLVARAAYSDTRLSFVLTPSLTSTFLRREVLPAADLLIASWDELETITRLPLQPNMPDAVRGIGFLHQHAPDASVLITMGSGGVLAYDASERTIHHVQLAPDVGMAVQQLIAEEPSCTCGAGDAFAGAAYVDREIGLSLLSGPLSSMPAIVRAAMSGCAGALRWLGFHRQLSPYDFRVGWPACPVDERIDGASGRACQLRSDRR